MTGQLLTLLRLGLGLALHPARMVEEAADGARRIAILAICGLTAAFILLPAVGCAGAGVWIFVQHRLGPVWAAFITAAAFLILALVILLIGLAASRSGRGRRRERRGGEAERPAAADPLAAIAPAILAFLASRRKPATDVPPGESTARRTASTARGFFGRHKGTMLLSALVAGLVLGQDFIRPRRRPKRD